LSRRVFLLASGALAVALVASDEAEAAANGAPNKPPLTPDQLDSYLAVEANGTVTVFYGRIDGGQGLETSIAQMVADEIDVPFTSVRMVMSDTARTLNMGGASGALGISRSGMHLRSCAAEARRLLLEMAATILSTPVQRLSVSEGIISAGGKKISYAELIGGRYFASHLDWNGKYGNDLVVSGKAKIKQPSELKIIGTSPRRKDLPLKVFAQLDMVNDVRL